MLSFLDLPDAGEVAPVQTGTLPSIRSQTLHQLGRVVLIARRNPESTSPLMRAVNAAIPSSWDGERVRRAWAKVTYGPPEPPDEELMRSLRRRFFPEVEAFGESIGRDLVSLWGYDRLD